MDEILTIIIRIAIIILSIGATWLTAWAKRYFTEKLGEEKTKKLDDIISTLTAAADQMLKTDDPDGSIRYQYVISELKNLGYTITDYIEAQIEARVYFLPHDTTKEKQEGE
jgi:hypothetical protein